MRPPRAPTGNSWPSRWRRISRAGRWTILVLVGLLIVARIALPAGVKAYVNRQLDQAPGYRGRIGDVEVHLWRGAYRIHNVSIQQVTGDVPVPLFEAKAVELSLQWRELFHRALVGEIEMEEPRINFVDGPTPEQRQSGQEHDWSKTLESLFPFRLNRVEIRHGAVHFQNLHSSPAVDIAITQLSASATNLTNSRDLTQPLPAGVQAQGEVPGGGRMGLELRLDPLAKTPTFELNAQLTNVALVSLNDFLRAYGKFDVERGIFALYTSVAAKEGAYEGYAKVFFENLDVFDWEKERKKNALEVFWQAIVGGLTTVFKNHTQDSLATKIPISGTYQGNSVGIWSSISTLLRHAFIRALVPKLDAPVKVEEVKPAPAKPSSDGAPVTPGKRV
ncbi:MAG TPA: DUF748 domain-containing protein [Candidatus Limnocylindria bacterium]|nr:DUF748 domain-containing protein [Candidatus Limnocylindria bacterium]